MAAQLVHTAPKPMLSIRYVHTHRGSCHCGNITTSLHTSKTALELGARACQCDWCRMQGGPSHTSDSAGKTEIHIKDPMDVSYYRMGTATADFLGCTRCHIVPAILWRREDNGQLFSVLRVQTLDARDHLMEHSRKMTVDNESVEARLERRVRTWTPTVMSEMRKSG